MNIDIFSCEGIVIIDLRGIILEVNKKFNMIFGYEGGEIIGKNISIIIPSPYRENHDEYLEKFKQNRESKFINSVRTVVGITKNGSYIPLNLSISLLDKDRAIGVFRDGSVEPMVSNAYFVVFNNGRILSANSSACEMFGYTIQSIVGKNINSIIPDLDLDNHEHFVHKIGQTVQGDNIHISVSVLQTDEKIYSVVTQDISEVNFYKKLHDELKITNDKLKMMIKVANNALKTKSIFLANMSHELRTPLNGVYGMLTMLNGTELNDTQKDYIDICTRSAECLLNIIDDILIISKASADKIVLERIPFSIDQLVEDVISVVYTNSMNNDNIDFVYYIDNKVPDFLIGDPSRLKQILLNLLSNASKFTEKGKVVLEIYKISDEPTILEFFVKDTGVGIPKKKLDKLFKPFSQVDDSITRKYGGSGLGLVICKTLVELYGGSIEVESEEGVGSTFKFTAKFDIDNKNKPQYQIDFENTLNGTNVIVLDESDINIKLLTNILSKFWCNVTVFNYKNGLKHLKDARDVYDIVIIRYNEKYMDKLYHFIEENGINIKIVTLCSFKERKTIINGENYVYLPIRKCLLIKKIYNLISDKTLHIQNDTVIQIEPKNTVSYSILLVEDNHINQKVLITMFDKLNCPVDTAENGIDGVNTIMKNPDKYDLVIMDIHMPIMDGMDATRILRSESITVPIVALTADITSDLRNRCLESGFDDFLIKPISFKQVKETVENITMYKKSSSIANRNVLIIDDHEVNLKVMEKLLNRLGYRCFKASNGQEAIHLIIGDGPDIAFILTNFDMPVFNGMEMVHELQDLGIIIPTIVVTGHDNEDIFKEVFNGYIRKPVSLNALINAINKIDKRNVTIKKIVNNEFFNSITSNDNDMRDMFLYELKDLLNTTIPQIKDAIKRNDSEHWSKIGHKLKGAFYQVGFDLFGYLSSKIEYGNKDDAKLYSNLLEKYANFYFQHVL